MMVMMVMVMVMMMMMRINRIRMIQLGLQTFFWWVKGRRDDDEGAKNLVNVVDAVETGDAAVANVMGADIVVAVNVTVKARATAKQTTQVNSAQRMSVLTHLTWTVENLLTWTSSQNSSSLDCQSVLRGNQ